MKKSINSQSISRKGSFDSGHRVLNQAFKCHNLHGHTYKYTLTFSYHTSQEIGYAIDFSEIKRIGCQWIDDTLDHSMILNPKDHDVITTTKSIGSKLWLMSLNGYDQYCNPSVENIAKEIFLAMEILFPENDSSSTGLEISEVKVYETPNCFTKVTSVSQEERENFRILRFDEIYKYYLNKGRVEYDTRNQTSLSGS